MSTKPKTLLIVDDDEGMRDTLTAILRRDYAVLTAPTGEAGLETLARVDVDLMLLDVRLPNIGGLEVLQIAKEQYPRIEAIVISAVSEVETAVQAIKQGAYHFITKDFEYDALRSLVRNASEKQDLSRQVESLSAQVADQNRVGDFVTGTSAVMRHVMDLVRKVAKLDTTVLVQGESGTGKEMIARRLHDESPNGRRPVHPGQPRGGAVRAGREHAVRPREGRLHRRGAAAARQVRDGRRRHAVPRRNRRPPPRPAGQAAARDPGRRDRARRRHQADQHRLPPRRRHPRRPRARHPRGPLPRGPLLPDPRHPDPDAGRCASGSRTCRRSSTSSPAATTPASTRP